MNPHPFAFKVCGRFGYLIVRRSGYFSGGAVAVFSLKGIGQRLFPGLDENGGGES